MKKTLVRLVEYLCNTKLIEIKQVGGTSQQTTVVNLKEGQSAYVIPWSYDPETKELNMSVSIYDSPQGTACMPITMKNGCIVVETDFDYFGEPYKW